MVRKLLGAAAAAAIACAFVPAHAAKVGIGCSGENLAKTESAVENMTDGPGKAMAQREVAQAQEAMLGGKMSGCATHLGRAMRASTLVQEPYAQGPYAQAPYAKGPYAQAPYPGTQAPSPYQTSTVARAPAETARQAQPQSQWGWQPVESAQ